MQKTCPVCGGTYADSNAFCPIDGTTLRADSTSTDLVGSVIADRYRISKLLGEGGMGRVYLAQHVRLPQQAAIKVMNPGMVQEQDAVARFNREAANAARIEHDRVARVFDFGETSDGLVYLAMEFVPGRTLRAVQEENGRLPPARAANISYQIAEGLDAAHRLSIVHRDLKPDNILVVTDEQGVDRCKVVDFGIAKAGDAKGTQITRTGMVVGTPEFMSPEQVVGESVDARSDVYALALVTFQMLAGELPFKGTTHERAVMSRLIENPQTLADVAPDVAWPDDLQAAFNEALEREPANRTASALAFAEAVVAATEQWLGAPVLRGRTPLGMSAVTRSQGMPSIGATPPTGVGAVPAAPAATSVGARGTAGVAAATPVATSAGGSRKGIVIGLATVALAVAGWAIFLRAPNSAASPVAADSALTSGSERAGVSAAEAAALRQSTSSQPAPAAAAATQGESSGLGSPRSSATDVTPQPPARPETAATTAPPGAAPPVATAPSAAAMAARRGVDSVRSVLESPSAGESEARAAIAHLQRLLIDLGSATDSTWAFLSLVNAYGQAGEPTRACNPLHRARRLATTEAQRQAVMTYFNSEALACVP
ncbi:MAG: serine/threonine-protein kinase [Gemmatimonadaceae bacterium]